MGKLSQGRWVIAVLVFSLAAGLALGQANPSLKDVLKKNVEASGGKAALGKVKTLSFKTGNALQTASASGELKTVTGKAPVVTEIVRVRGGKVERNSFNSLSEPADPQKTVNQTLAKVFAGVFTLAKFEGQLKLEGIKSFGPEKLYHLTLKAKTGTVTPNFYLKTDDFTLKRLVFQVAEPGGGRYEINYDFAPFEEVEGIKMPLAWFSSQTGTRGNLNEVTDVKVNPKLPPGFFSAMDLNMGSVKAAPGSLTGNVLDVNSFPGGLMVVTNWTKKDVEQAGLKSGDELTFSAAAPDKPVAINVVFYMTAGEMPPPGPPGAPGRETRILGPAQRGGETYVLQVSGPAASEAAGKIAVLAPISVKKISQ